VDTAPNYSDVVPSAGSSGTTLTLKNNIPTSVVSGMKVFRNGIDTGITTTAAGTATDATAVGTATTVTLSGALSLNAGDAISFYPGTGTLNMTLIAPDGTEIPVTGASNKEAAGTTFNVVTENVEVYASLDGHFYDMSGSGATANWDITPQTTGLGYKPISKISFWGGRNIDGLIEDPSSGNPAFHTITKLTTTVTQASGAVEAVEFNLDLTDTKLMAADFQVTASVQDGEPATRLTNVSIDSTGRLIGVYGNGKQFIAAQVALAHFDNYEGLVPVGENAFAQSVDSGTIGSEGTQLGVAGQGVFGDIKSLALESSNVDLANELVKLMVLQRAYTANSQSMRATDQLIRDTLQMSN
jgi:flagellar hook protein FlgE